MTTKPEPAALPATDRKRMARELGVVLADTHTLYLTTHGYHWNVTGPTFPALHSLFEQQYNELWLAIDLIAERIRSLGHPAPFRASTFAEEGHLREGKATRANAMLEDLLHSHEAMAQTLHRTAAAAEKAGDQATMDMLVGRLAAHDKAAWMLRATLAKEA